jgi:hypothetical protein
MNKLITNVQALVERACARSTLLAAQAESSTAFMEAKQDCKHAIQVLRAIVLENNEPRDKLWVCTNHRIQFIDFQHAIKVQCGHVGQPEQLAGLLLNNLVIIGTLAGIHVNHHDIQFLNEVSARIARGKTRIWHIEEWR